MAAFSYPQDFKQGLPKASGEDLNNKLFDDALQLAFGTSTAYTVYPDNTKINSINSISKFKIKLTLAGFRCLSTDDILLQLAYSYARQRSSESIAYTILQTDWLLAYLVTSPICTEVFNIINDCSSPSVTKQSLVELMTQKIVRSKIPEDVKLDWILNRT